MVERIVETAGAEALARRVLAVRERPLVVVSTDAHSGRLLLDVDELKDAVGDVADIVTITTGEHTWALNDLLPDKTQVYGGAGRSYPVDFGLDPDWRRSPLRFPGARVTGRLIGDVLAQANAAGLFASRPSASQVRASGTVKGFVGGSRALVDVQGRGLATVSRELTYPPIPLEWTLSVGQRVEGTLDLDSRRLLVERPAPSIAALSEAFPHHSVTLALVKKVSASRAVLLLHPGVPLTVLRADISSNPHDTVDLLLAEGDVVAVRVYHLSTGGLHLSMLDVEDDEPVVPALALTSGGPPWLAERRVLVHDEVVSADEHLAALETAAEKAPLVVEVAPGDVASTHVVASSPAPARLGPMPGPGLRPGLSRAAAAASAPAALAGSTVTAAPGTALHATQLSLAQARADNTELKRRLADAGADDSGIQRLRARASGAEARLREELAERGALERRLRELEDQHRMATKALRGARRSTSAPAVDDRDRRRARWATDEQWVRHEIYLAWVERVGAGERPDRPIGDYVVGPEFAESLAGLDDGRFAKAMRASVDAVIGRIREVPGREVHPLRTGDGATAADVVRADGARCFRAYIEQKTAQARRLHYWTLPNGGVELGRIVLHDDVEP